MLKGIEICADRASHRLWPARVPPPRILGKRAHSGRPMMRAYFCIGLSVFLTASLSFAQTSTAPSRAAAQDYSFTIPGSWGWLDTNIELYPGDRVHITGAVIDCAGPTPTEILDVPLPSAPVGALLAKLHAEAEPVLATPDAEFSITAPSHLFLGVNGWRCPGKIPAKVHVERRAAETRKR